MPAASSNSDGSTEIGCTVTSDRWSPKAARSLGEVARGPGQVARGAKEVQPPALGVEADHVVRQQPLVDLAPDRSRQHVPVVGLRPGDVDEVRHQRVRRALPHEPRREVELVVVEEDRGVRIELELLEHRLGEAFVHARVPLVPGVLERHVQRGRVRKLPEVVLQEPEHRVGDDVVEPVVGRLVVLHQAQPERRAVARALLDRGAAGLGHHHPVLVAHRARDPGDVVVRDEAAQRGHETAASPRRNALAVLTPPERDRTAVRDDDQMPATRHGGPTLPGR